MQKLKKNLEKTKKNNKTKKTIFQKFGDGVYRQEFWNIGFIGFIGFFGFLEVFLIFAFFTFTRVLEYWFYCFFWFSRGFFWFLHFFTFTRVLEYWFYWFYCFFWFSRGFFDFCIFYICKTSIILFFLRTNNAYLYICIYDTPFAHEKGRLLGGGTIFSYSSIYVPGWAWHM